MRPGGSGAATVGDTKDGKRRRPCDAPKRLRLRPSSSAGAVTPTGGGLPVVRFALPRRRRGLRETRFPPGVGGCLGPQRPWHRGAPPLAGGGGSGNDGVLLPARCCGAAGSRVTQSASVLPSGPGADPSSFSASGSQCSPMSPGGLPSSVSDAVGLHVCATASPLLLGTGVLGGRTVCGDFLSLLFCASMRCGRSPSCGADAAVSDGEDVLLRQRLCTGGCGRCCAETGWPVVCRLCGVPLRLVSAFGALARVSSSASHVLTAGRVNPD